MNKKLSKYSQNMLDILCHNLAQYQYLYQRYEPLQSLKTFNELLDFYTEKNYLEAKSKLQIVSELSKQLAKEKNENFKIFIKNQINHLKNTFIGNIYQLGGNKSVARHFTNNNLWLGEFELVFADQKKQARPFDSAAALNLFGFDGENIFTLAKTLRYHYRALSSTGPVFETHALTDRPGNETVHILLSEKKPPKLVHHQIWLNDELMLRSTFKTNKSLSEYLNQSYDASKALIYAVGYAEEIFKKMGNNRSQSILHQEYLSKRLEFAKMKTANYLEQYLLIATELFCKIIQELKKRNNLPTNVPVFDDIEKLLSQNKSLTKDDIRNMQTYLSIRNHFAHQNEYNFKPFSNSYHADPLLKNFKTNMVHFLSTILDIPQDNFERKINTHPEEAHYDVYSLFFLMDMRAALRDLCVTHANLSPNQQNVFLKLKFITKEETKLLNKAHNLRNTICHEKLNSELAEKAQEAAKSILPIIEKISDQVQHSFNVSVRDYYNPKTNLIAYEFSDIKKKFPFLNIDSENDPDTHIFYDTLLTKAVDKKLIQKMYLIAHLFQNIILKKYTLQANPYFDEKELEPILKEYHSYQNINANNFRKHLFKAIASVWLQTGKLPQIKKENIHE